MGERESAERLGQSVPIPEARRILPTVIDIKAKVVAVAGSLHVGVKQADVHATVLGCLQQPAAVHVAVTTVYNYIWPLAQSISQVFSSGECHVPLNPFTAAVSYTHLTLPTNHRV